MIKCVVFDFDGTMVDSMGIAVSAINRIAEKHNYKKLGQKDLEYLSKMSIAERCKSLNVPIYKLPFWAAEFYSLYKNYMNQLSLFEGIKELLDELNDSGYQIAVISSNSENNIREFLHKSEIGYIKQILCSNRILGKDVIIKKFLKDNKLKNHEVIYVGDEQRDVVACKKSGVKVIWVEWGFDDEELVRNENPDYTAAAPKDIISIIKACR